MTKITNYLLMALGFGLSACATQGGVQMAQDESTAVDKVEIADLVNRWTFYRDQESWADLQSTFAEDGTISISWFYGKHSDFVLASQKLAERGRSVLKHQIGVPVIAVRGDRAISEVNVIIMVRANTPIGEIDTTSYARFYDKLVKVDGDWKIAERFGIYEKDRVDPVDRASLPDDFYSAIGDYPKELKFLASNLQSAGLPISTKTILDKSVELGELYRKGKAWLHEVN